MENQFYIGSFQSNNNAVILKCRFNDASAEITVLDRLNAPRPSWLTTDENGHLLFAMETAELDGEEGGGIGIVGIHNGEFNLKSKLKIGSKGPTHLSCYGDFVYCSCYAEGTLVEVGLADGEFTGKIRTFKHEGKSVHKVRQDRPHPHFSLVTPDERYLAVCDLGLDKIMLYPIDRRLGITGEPRAYFAPSGTGPRHAVFSKDGRYLYVVCEMGCVVLTYAYFEGALTLVDSISTIEENESTVSQCGAIRINESGSELVVTNRGHDTAVFFTVCQNGKLIKNGSVKTPKWPRDCCFSPSGKWLLAAGQRSDEIEVYRYFYSDSAPLLERVRTVGITKLDDGVNPSSILFVD